jgi:hypothetical protein
MFPLEVIAYNNQQAERAAVEQRNKIIADSIIKSLLGETTDAPQQHQ